MNSSVLVCDDSNLARKQVLRSLPEEWQVDIQTATNGQEALDIIRSQKIDVLFLDLTMPVLDGLGVLQSLKDEKLECTVFVISADVQPEMQSKVLNLGAKAFLRKPVKAETLISNLEHHGYL